MLGNLTFVRKAHANLSTHDYNPAPTWLPKNREVGRLRLARGNGLLGVRINNIKARDGRVDAPGLVPGALTKLGAPVYTYEYGKLGEWVEKAYKAANRGI
jgi:hypothetical protein